MSPPVVASTTVAEALRLQPLAARLLVKHHMHCVGCAIAPFETVAEACKIYGVPLRDMLAELNDTPAETLRSLDVPR